MLKGFREFILRGNIVDLAVAVVIGTAFTALVTAFVADLITPLIASIGGQPDFSKLAFTINGSTFLIGDFINKLIAFLIVALVVYLMIVVPMNRINARLKPAAAPTTRSCPECLSDIPLAARRCAFCTAVLPAGT
jgi:large conductance mechanosensitive channel